MGRWVILGSLAMAAAPALVLGADKPPAKPAAPHAAAAAGHPGGGGVPSRGVGGVGGAPAAGPSRSFGAAPAGGGAPGGRSFGGGSPGAAGGSARSFGGGAPGAESSGARSFGAGASRASAGHAEGAEGAAGGERHFGASAGHPAAAGSVREAHEGALAEGRAGGHFDDRGRAMRGANGRFVADRYDYPRGYAYQRWGVGRRFPHEYWRRDYYIDDYAAYGLDPAPYGFQWVRYGPDILLINLETGEVMQAVYGAFEG